MGDLGFGGEREEGGGDRGKCVPIEARRFWPTTMTHSTMAAPELSMQLSIV